MASVRVRGGSGRLSAASPANSTETPEIAPRREGVMHPPPRRARTLDWRVIVRVRDLNTTTEWHLTSCEQPAVAEAHCDEGRRLMTAEGQPDGHCLTAGRCARCDSDRPVRTPRRARANPNA